MEKGISICKIGIKKKSMGAFPAISTCCHQVAVSVVITLCNQLGTCFSSESDGHLPTSKQADLE